MTDWLGLLTGRQHKNMVTGSVSIVYMFPRIIKDGKNLGMRPWPPTMEGCIQDGTTLWHLTTCWIQPSELQTAHCSWSADPVSSPSKDGIYFWRTLASFYYECSWLSPKLTLIEEADWLELVEFTQPHTHAWLQCQQKASQQFRTWARTDLPTTLTMIPLWRKRKLPQSGSIAFWARHCQADLKLPPSQARDPLILAPSSMTLKKYKCPPDRAS
jgi:hypothetical protein